MKPTYGRQRNYAMAMGIDVASIDDYDVLSNLMDYAKQTLAGRPNERQALLARQWGIQISEGDSGWDAVGKIYPMIQSQVFVYSVVRRLMSTKWRYYYESPIPHDWVIRTAWRLYYEPGMIPLVMEMENAISGTIGDAWYRFGKRQMESKPFQFVYGIAIIELGSLIAENPLAPPLPKQAAPPTIVRASTATRNRARAKSGCMILLFAISSAILSISIFLLRFA